MSVGSYAEVAAWLSEARGFFVTKLAFSCIVIFLFVICSVMHFPKITMAGARWLSEVVTTCCLIPADNAELKGAKPGADEDLVGRLAQSRLTATFGYHIGRTHFIKTTTDLFFSPGLPPSPFAWLGASLHHKKKVEGGARVLLCSTNFEKKLYICCYTGIFCSRLVAYCVFHM